MVLAELAWFSFVELLVDKFVAVVCWSPLICVILTCAVSRKGKIIMWAVLNGIRLWQKSSDWYCWGNVRFVFGCVNP